MFSNNLPVGHFQIILSYLSFYLSFPDVRRLRESIVSQYNVNTTTYIASLSRKHNSNKAQFSIYLTFIYLMRSEPTIVLNIGKTKLR